MCVFLRVNTTDYKSWGSDDTRDQRMGDSVDECVDGSVEKRMDGSVYECVDEHVGGSVDECLDVRMIINKTTTLNKHQIHSIYV